MFITVHSVSSSSSHSVLAAEQRQILAADERKREFHEEKRNEFESYAEEEHDGTQTLASDEAEQDELVHSNRLIHPLKLSLSARTRREDQREHRAVEGVSLRRDASSPRVQPSLHLRLRGGRWSRRLTVKKHKEAFLRRPWQSCRRHVSHRKMTAFNLMLLTLALFVWTATDPTTVCVKVILIAKVSQILFHQNLHLFLLKLKM